jgi:Type I phosphodiesterase / nucleotide pyrophosphatase
LRLLDLFWKMVLMQKYRFLKILSLGLILLLATGCAGPTLAPEVAERSAAPLSVGETSEVVPVFSPTSTPVITEAVRTPSPSPTPISTATPAPPAATSTPAATPTPAATATGVATCECGLPDCACAIDHVVIISIDGLRPDALELADTPIFDALRRRGAYSPKAQSVLPSVTLVNHASMLGGMSPEKHGIYWNENDPDLGLVKGPTLFSVAHEGSFSTAMVVGKPKFQHLALPDSVDQYVYAGFLDQQVVEAALGVIEGGLPDLLFIHLPDVDSAGHLAGWMTPAQLLTIGATDSQLGEVVAALAEGDYLDSTLLIITADHGGSGFAHGGDTLEEMTIPWLAVGPGVPVGVTLSGEITTYDTAATALYALNLPIPESWDGIPVPEIFQ